MSGNKALKRALVSTDAIRVGTKLPLISDQTELITPETAQEYLKRNHGNRPVNWRRVEAYSVVMKRGEWALHSQGIIFDEKGNLLTGQTRLWAVVYSGVSVYMRVSRGNPRHLANLIDRGRPQSARDLATRETERKHSPLESSVARALCVLRGNVKPSTDELAKVIATNKLVSVVLQETSGSKKTKDLLMVLAAICEIAGNESEAKYLASHASTLVNRLERLLLPQTADRCWGKGSAFSLAMEHARTVVLAKRSKA